MSDDEQKRDTMHRVLSTGAVVLVLGALNYKVYEIDKAVGEAKCSSGSKWSAMLLNIVSFLIGVITACGFSGGCTSTKVHYLIPVTLVAVITCCIGLIATCGGKVDGVKSYIGALLAVSFLLFGGYIYLYKDVYLRHVKRIAGDQPATRSAPVVETEMNENPTGSYRHRARGRF